ncbi:hypothetical protein OAE48_01145 [Flavobacteriales bacterium]|nr:hypothetical protein [Flavobacteriales bacterium]
MSETANNIYTKTKKEKSLSDVGVDLLASAQTTWVRHRISMGIMAIILLAGGWLKLIITIESVYLNTITPALAITAMAALLRLFEGPKSNQQ